MERLLARLERRFGRYAPGNLTYVLVAAQFLGFLLGFADHEKLAALAFDRYWVLHGQPWRVVSWLAIPPSTSPIWAFFSLFWLYRIGTSLESEWGAFKFAVYWLMGMLSTLGTAWLIGAPASNVVFVMTLFLAFATLWPDYQVLLFVVPVKVKWLAYLDAVYLLYFIFQADGLQKLLPLMGVANYLLFFGVTLIDRVRGFKRQASRAGVRNRMRSARAESALPKDRRCAICGASNRDPEVELRVCNCAKCGGVMRDLCLEHARNH